MSQNKILLSLAAIFLTMSGTAGEVHAQEKAAGRLCDVFTIEQITPTKADNTCYQPSYRNEVGQCVHATETHNAFTYIINQDNSLDFGLSYWFGSGHSCSIIGSAESTGKNKWRLQRDLDDPAKSCTLDISIQNEMVIFDTLPESSCRYSCGAQAQLIGVTLPLSAAESTKITRADLDPEVMFNTPCHASP